MTIKSLELAEPAITDSHHIAGFQRLLLMEGFMVITVHFPSMGYAASTLLEGAFTCTRHFRVAYNIASQF